ncbi:hypothetical protein Tco_0186326 [Tanacetum coccineum]
MRTRTSHIHVRFWESGVLHILAVSSPYRGLSDIVHTSDDHELLEPPYMLEDPYTEAALQAPPSPNYVPGPEEPEQAPPSPDYVPEMDIVEDEGCLIWSSMREDVDDVMEDEGGGGGDSSAPAYPSSEPLPVPAWSDSEVARLLAISSPPASPLSPWSSSPPQIPFPVSPPLPVLTAPPPSPIRS